MSRFAFGPEIGPVSLVAAPAPAGGGTPPAAPVALPDLPVAFAGVDSEGNFSFAVPAFDATKYASPLVAIHVALFENAADGTLSSAIPTDPAAVVAALAEGEKLFNTVLDPDASGTTGGTVVVDATEADEGDYTALSVLEFAS